jgi:hypothetical protein
MVIVKTSHNKIWNPEQVAVDIVKEYQDRGRVVVNLNSEGPCADSVGLYRLLDYLCDRLSIEKARIAIETVNFEETHPEYRIVKKPQHWIKQINTVFDSLNFVPEKSVSANLFGCLYNVPSWDRLCILAHAHKLSNSCVLHCNGTDIPHRYNTYYLDSLADHAPQELSAVAEYIKTQPRAALNDVYNKPVEPRDLMQVTELYNQFFVDIVAETYTQGLSFFITEKTLRPMLALTPFVAQAPQGFLSTLRSDYGIRTFDQWWDESYDQAQNYDRIKKIYAVMTSLDQLTLPQREQMYSEMLPVLHHNQKRIRELS